MEDKNIEKLQTFIHDFCSLILTSEDKLEKEKGRNFAKSISNEDVTLLNNSTYFKQCNALIQKEVLDYIENFKMVQGGISPFEFDTFTTVKEFKEDFNKAYKESHCNNSIPEILSKAFDYIDDMSEHYRVFEKFFKIRYELISTYTIETAKNEASQIAAVAVEEKTKETIQKTAIEEVQKEVDKKIFEVTKTTSENSVTIIGIFASIILTIVGGFIYSTSVINNMSNPNFYRLISISALVGLVCYNFLSSLYYFIGKIKNWGQKTKFFDYFNGVANIVLFAVFLTFSILEFNN